MKIGDKQFFNLSKFHLPVQVNFPVQSVFLSLIEDMLYCVYSTFSKKSKDLLFSNTFFHFFCQKICTVCMHFLVHVKNPQYYCSNSGKLTCISFKYFGFIFRKVDNFRICCASHIFFIPCF